MIFRKQEGALFDFLFQKVLWVIAGLQKQRTTHKEVLRFWSSYRMPSLRTQAADVINPTDGLTTSAAALGLKQSILYDHQNPPFCPGSPKRPIVL